MQGKIYKGNSREEAFAESVRSADRFECYRLNDKNEQRKVFSEKFSIQAREASNI